MKRLLLSLLLVLLSGSTNAQRPLSPPNVDFSISEMSKIERQRTGNKISIQGVQLKSAPGVDSSSVRKINVGLTKAKAKFTAVARRCRSVAEGHPWGYRATLESIVLSDQYISFVYSRETVCAGTPGFEKDPIVFSKKTGEFVPSDNLIARTFPDEMLPPNIQLDKQSIQLTETLTERLIAREIARGDFDQRCEFYLMNTSYKVWVEAEKLVLFPEFSQADSHCQKEYFIDIK